MRTVRAVVDTNVWISALLNPAGAPARVRRALQDARFELVASEPTLAELGRVAASPRLIRRYGLDAAAAAELVSLIESAAHLVPVTGDVRLCRDPMDDMVIETALAGRADALVTRDDDLKGESDLVSALRERGVSVMTVRHFLEALETRTSSSTRP